MRDDAQILVDLNFEDKLLYVVNLAIQERYRQKKKWGWPRSDQLLVPSSNLGSATCLIEAENLAREEQDRGDKCWLSVLAEEVGEVARETMSLGSPHDLINELVQVAAVALAYAQHVAEVEDIPVEYKEDVLTDDS